LGDGKATRGPFSLATGLSLAEFFLPLLKPMIGQPAIQQQSLRVGRVARGDGGYPRQFGGPPY
jgi:hypothetical protein